jgi:flagellar hook protein FlgE
MMSSLSSAVSGLKGSQEMMDVIGNNIANVNTPGFKSSQVNFADLLSQSMRGASLPTSTAGGTNPIQIGQGVTAASVDTNFTGGSMQTTGVSTDLGIDGDGLFVLGSGSNQYYTRDGDFSLDSSGNLVSNANGMYVQGWLPNSSGTIDTTATPANISINLNDSVPAQATSNMTLSGNLDEESTGTLVFTGGSASTQFAVTDGTTSGTWKLAFTQGSQENEYNWTVTDTSTGDTLGSGTLTLDKNGDVTKSVTNTAVSEQVNGGVDTFKLAAPAAGGKASDFVLTSVVTATNVAEGTPSINNATGAGASTLTTTAPVSYTPVTQTMPVKAYDSLGNLYSINLTLTESSPGNWTWAIPSNGITDSSGATYSSASAGSLTFDSTGALSSGSPGSLTFTPTNGASPVTIALDFSGLTQYDSAASASMGTQNGYTSGTLQDYSIGTSGTITGSFSNGVTKSLGQIALANFANPNGLQSDGNNTYSATANSGAATVNTAGTGSLGTIKTDSLEASNVDLSQEMSNMIIAQSAFDANSKVITTDDQLLQALDNMIPA